MENHMIRQQLQTAYQNRVAMRVYQDKKIPQEDIDTILDAAWLSPSSIGLEGWRFVLLENTAVKEAIKAVSWGQNCSWKLLATLSFSLLKKMPVMIANPFMIV